VLRYGAPRPDSRRRIDDVRTLGVGIKVLTGHALPVARAVARELALGEIVGAPALQAAQKGICSTRRRASSLNLSNISTRWSNRLPRIAPCTPVVVC